MGKIEARCQILDHFLISYLGFDLFFVGFLQLFVIFVCIFVKRRKIFIGGLHKETSFGKPKSLMDLLSFREKFLL